MDLAELEALVRANRDDRELRKLYTDFLIEKGDPRGEHASICDLLSIEAPPGGYRNGRSRDELLEQKRALEEAHLEWTGELSNTPIVWLAGYFDRVELREQHLLPALLRLESSRFLRSLSIELQESFLPVLPTGLHERCDVLLELELRGGGHAVERMDLTLFSSLETARVPLGDWTIMLPRSLRSVYVTGEGALSKRAVVSLGAACGMLSGLRSLTLDLGETWRPVERSDLAAILTLATSGLTHLSVRRTSIAGDILRALASIGPLTLERLHLEGTFSVSDLELAQLPTFSRIEMDLRSIEPRKTP